MAYTLKFMFHDDAQKFHDSFIQKLAISRFKCEIKTYPRPKITLHNIRLTESSPYCGSHAGPCLLPNRKDRKARFLQGADWIGFGDLINNICDEHGIAADVASVACVVRRAEERCVEYYGGNRGEWEKLGRYENHCFQPSPETIYPSGTPGDPNWRVSNGG